MGEKYIEDSEAPSSSQYVTRHRACLTRYSDYGALPKHAMCDVSRCCSLTCSEPQRPRQLAAVVERIRVIESIGAEPDSVTLKYARLRISCNELQCGPVLAAGDIVPVIAEAAMMGGVFEWASRTRSWGRGKLAATNAEQVQGIERILGFVRGSRPREARAILALKDGEHQCPRAW